MKKMFFVCLLLLGTLAKAQTGYQVGGLAENFSLKNVDGKQVSLADYPNAKGFIVVFTCNTCPVAQAYQQRIEELNKQFALKGFPVIAINGNDAGSSPGDSYPKMQSYAKEKKFSYVYLEDPDQIYTKKYGATRTPHVFVLQKTAKGNEVAYIGAIDDVQEGSPNTKYVAEAVNALLDGKKPNVSFTKAIGCGIKWKRTSE